MIPKILFFCLGAWISFSAVTAEAVVCTAQCVGYYQVWGPGHDELKSFGPVSARAENFSAAFQSTQELCLQLGKEGLANRLDQGSWQIFMATAVSFSSAPNRSLNVTYASPMNACFNE